MSNRILTLLMGLVIIGMAVLLFINVLSFFGDWDTTPKKFLSQYNVKGIAVEKKGKLYTLNFPQHNRMVRILNRSVAVGHDTYLQSKKAIFPYSKVIIYPFEGPDLVLTPIGFINQQLVFKVPDWNPRGLLRETGPGELTPLLKHTYDP